MGDKECFEYLVNKNQELEEKVKSLDQENKRLNNLLVQQKEEANERMKVGEKPASNTTDLQMSNEKCSYCVKSSIHFEREKQTYADMAANTRNYAMRRKEILEQEKRDIEGFQKKYAEHIAIAERVIILLQSRNLYKKKH